MYWAMSHVMALVDYLLLLAASNVCDDYLT